MQRLAQVVAGGGEELRLRAVGHLGLAPRRVGGGLLGAQLRGQPAGLALQLEHPVVGTMEVAPDQRRQRKDRPS